MTLRSEESPAGLLLAAGEGRRLGRPKATVELDGERLVDRGVRTLRDGGCSPVLVVAGAAQIEVIGAVVVPNPDWRDGMGSSLRAGLAALPPGCPAVVVALVDQPLVTPAAVERLIAAFAEGAGIAVATYGGAPRNPVLLGAGHLAGVAEAAVGDQGARGYLRARPELVTPVPCDDVAAPDDIDTPEDLAALNRPRAGRSRPAPRSRPHGAAGR
ncbi:nucleotidyltransferase family protein [Actinomadura citrea]|jgi:nicotine blue oxidoreductase|uniref:Nicotine blue oxidoreductase n=1 Tax=Actinomadura citrea TaxID=46158 RepID=A0A7Y9KEI8_9ACTN|nr:nucleotidyltransferase family protein [Actinomadura citrea]NYE12639.1 nicotine blue oxidoreductase [Actinomadura citrea]GGT53411.1 4-diphosphocytidyl-2C-methyl-D-erythritol kinase [Actinomadura citrea]